MSRWMPGEPERAHEIDTNEIDLNEIDLNEIDLNEIDLNEIDLNEVDEETAEEILVLADAPAPTLPVWEPTGDPAVDAALEELARLDEFDRSEQIAIFESVHRRLHERLSDLAAGS